MSQTSLEKNLEQALSKNPEFLSSEGEIRRDRIIDGAYSADRILIELLLSESDLKEKFFSEIKGHWVFNINDFVMFVQDKHFLNDSYTQYKNKIGLNIDGKFLRERKEVALVWPFKDCVLEGGMTKEDQKKKEIFFNEILAQDEIDQLFSAKVLTNWKRYTIKGKEEVGTLKRDEDGTIRENLIIKGNNLLALHTLQEQFRGKVKLIYIDPPYNTGSDSFGYNDSFNHSTWLTFMKNRLEVARSLLCAEGFIFIQCDDNEQAYLKLLMDEVFGRENFRNSIYWHRTYAGKTVSKNLPWNVDILHVYSKTIKSNLNNVTTKLTEKDIAAYTKDDSDGRGKYSTVSLQKTGNPGPKTTYDYIDNKGKVWTCPRKGWRMTQEKLKKLENDNRLYISGNTIREKYYLEERLGIGKQIDNFWADLGNLNRSSDTDYELSGQKPEKLIERVISMVTDTGDIVMDYHLGSGTTAAVAHKMNRQYLGIEQIDNQINLLIKRLNGVIGGDDTGISKSVDWKGGGDFIYCELLKYNESFIEEIEAVSDVKLLLKVWGQMKKKAFFKHNFEMQEFDKDIEEFKKLDLQKQKQILFGILDKNQLYVNYSEIDDKKFKVEKEDKATNKEFYGE